jgi:nicotinamidase/pyrazinamidase
MRITVTPKDALIVVDMQKDFMPGGALPVPKADTIIPTVNSYVQRFFELERPVYFTRDYHPADHISFKEFGGLWPSHCVAGSEGARFVEGLFIPPDNRFIISKGTSKEFDAYSGFQGTILHDLLQERGIQRVFVCGVATEYCVYNTALGAMNLGYQCFVLEDAIKGVNEEGAQKALDKLLKQGAVLASSTALKS